MKTTWKKWRVGFWIQVLLGCLAAGAGLAAGVTWKQFVAILCTSLTTQLVGYLSKSPLEDVEDEAVKSARSIPTKIKLQK